MQSGSLKGKGPSARSWKGQGSVGWRSLHKAENLSPLLDSSHFPIYDPHFVFTVNKRKSCTMASWPPTSARAHPRTRQRQRRLRPRTALMVVQQAKVPFFLFCFSLASFSLAPPSCGYRGSSGGRSFIHQCPFSHYPRPTRLPYYYLPVLFLQLAHVDGDDTSSSPLQTGGEGGWGCLWLSKPG